MNILYISISALLHLSAKGNKCKIISLQDGNNAKYALSSLHEIKALLFQVVNHSDFCFIPIVWINEPFMLFAPGRNEEDLQTEHWSVWQEFYTKGGKRGVDRYDSPGEKIIF